jgi:hypothetical protein
MDAVKQWTFRIGYAVVGIGLAVTSLTLLVMRATPDSDSSQSQE